MFKLLLILTTILTNNPFTQNANIGALICDYHTGDTIHAYRHNAVIPPASTMKLLTTATALDLWGSEHTFQTPITYSGYIQDSTLYGNLYIEGQGDPTLQSRHLGDTLLLQHWAQRVHQAGIRHIQGSVIADISAFDSEVTHPDWLWQDIGNYYAPGIFALSYRDNTMRITLRSGEQGSTAEVLETYPHIPDMQFDNHIRCTDISYDGAYVNGIPFSNYRHLVGEIPSNRQTFTIMGDLPNPALLLAQDLTTTLKQHAITVSQAASYTQTKTNDFAQRSTIFVHHSLPLAQIIQHTNQQSDNLYAEMLFRTLGAQKGEAGTINQSIQFIRQYWKDKGIDLQDARLLDGCGLAPQDAISPAMHVQLLRYIYGSEHKDAFLQSLPCSGTSGTLKSFLKDTALHGKVYAKSGTIGGTRNYAGYIFLPDGRVWVFAVMINSANCKSSQIRQIIEEYLLHAYQANT